MQTVLVTGANGFVGSHVLEALAAAPVTTVAACRDPARLSETFHGEVRQGDLRDPVYRQALLQGVDVVCHTAAWTSLWGNEQASRELFLEPSLALLADCVAAGVKRFVFLSTTSAAAPARQADPMADGIPRTFWPHLSNVVAIEKAMRQQAGDTAMINLRCGLFIGQRYNLGLLPILLPRLKTHLVPWVAGGRSGMPLVDGRDIAQAFRLAATATGLSGYQGFDVIGSDIPSAREVIDFLHAEARVPVPHFSVPFWLAYPFAWLMERLDPVLPWEPLVVRSIIHLLEDTGADNRRAREILGYVPQFHWKDSVRLQLEEMRGRQLRPMKMAVPVMR